MSTADTKNAAKVFVPKTAIHAKKKSDADKLDAIENKFRKCHAKCMEKFIKFSVSPSELVDYLIAAGCWPQKDAEHLIKKSEQELNALACNCRCGIQHPLPTSENVTVTDTDGTEHPEAINIPPFAPS